MTTDSIDKPFKRIIVKSYKMLFHLIGFKKKIEKNTVRVLKRIKKWSSWFYCLFLAIILLKKSFNGQKITITYDEFV